MYEIREKYSERINFFSKATGRKAAPHLKMNSFTSIFREFCFREYSCRTETL